jgi:hypothetical protein
MRPSSSPKKKATKPKEFSSFVVRGLFQVMRRFQSELETTLLRFKPHWQKKFRAKLFFSSASPGAGGNPGRQGWQVSSLGREML